MASPLIEMELVSRVRQAYSDGLAMHGYLELDPKQFANRLYEIIQKHLGPLPEREALLKFFGKLYTKDLYLSTACALGSETAWKRFDGTYKRHILRVAESACSSRDTARDLADSLLAHLFLPNSSGCCRIASYCGLSSLATWLTVIINNRAINERERKYNNLDRLDLLPEMADHAFTTKVEASIRASKYEPQIEESLRETVRSLTEREKLLLVLRYEDEMKISEIARFFHTHSSTISRQIQSVQEKVRKKTIEFLNSRHRLSGKSLDECLADILENPWYSILSIIKED